MSQLTKASAFILGFFIFIGLATLGLVLANAAIETKQFERSVKVKGLAEHEYQADIVIWPIEFSLANNNLESLYEAVEYSTDKIESFLLKNGI